MDPRRRRAAVHAGHVPHAPRLRGRHRRAAHEDGPPHPLHARPPVDRARRCRGRRARARCRRRCVGTDDWVPLAQGRHEPSDARGARADVRRRRGRAAAPEQGHRAARRRARRRAGGAADGGAAGDLRRAMPRAVGRGQADGHRAARRGRAGGLDVRGTMPRDGEERQLYAPSEIALDAAFWRVAGLYLAEGCTTLRRPQTAPITGRFIPTQEQHLVDEVVAFWLRHGVARALVARRRRTS